MQQRLKDVKIGFALTGSYCTFAQVLPEIKVLTDEGAEIYPIVSENVSKTDTRFMKVDDLYAKLEILSGREVIDEIVKAEPIGPLSMLDLVIIAPCTGNTLSKLALGITDTPVLMAAKAQLRNNKPVLIAPSTNDALGASAKNIGLLMNTKNIFIVPMRQDAPIKKQDSLVSDMHKIADCAIAAIKNIQLQPILF